MSLFNVSTRLRFTFLVLMTSILTVGVSATVPYANAAANHDSAPTSSAVQTNTTINQTCKYNKTVNTQFYYGNLVGPIGLSNTHAFTIQFTNLNYCYNGQTIEWVSRPEARAYIKNESPIPGGANWYNIISMTCAEKFDFPGNGNQPSIYITCELGMANNSWYNLNGFYSERAIDASSDFNIPVRLNWNLMATFSPPSVGVSSERLGDQSRFYTLRINANGYAGLSGVGNPSLFTP
ncbi:MAG: hypothetical protein AAGF95_00610 [Chloroflexota bacterium]